MKDQQLDQKASNRKGRNYGNAWAKKTATGISRD
jgi:hypothetical protein